MTFIETDIKGVIIFEPRLFEDNRGYFFESYNKKLFEENGIKADFVQDNESFSKFGTIRGLHFQKGEAAQAKLIKVISGRILDVAVDIRANSPTFGKCVCVELNDRNKHEVFIPRGFAHGFSVLSESAVISYKCDNLYSPSDEGSVKFNDTELNIDWGFDISKAVLSDKDINNPSFADYRNNPCFF